ncbi:MAG: Kazal-type serine protease inhibitor family protein [Cyclobacteriaceae bacterium]
MKKLKLVLSLFVLVAVAAISVQSFAAEGQPKGGCVCPAVYDPVCTDDGQEFSNSCFAECAGYKRNEYESCGAAVAMATSTQSKAAVWPPYACPDVYDPVCTYDGRQFGNSCYAGLAGYSSDKYYKCGVSVN